MPPLSPQLAVPNHDMKELYHLYEATSKMVEVHQHSNGVQTWFQRVVARNNQRAQEWFRQFQFHGFVLDSAADVQPAAGAGGHRHQIRGTRNVTVGNYTGAPILHHDVTNSSLTARVGNEVMVEFLAGGGAARRPTARIRYATDVSRYDVDQALATFVPLFQNHLAHDKTLAANNPAYKARVEEERLGVLTALHGALTRQLEGYSFVIPRSPDSPAAEDLAALNVLYQ